MEISLNLNIGDIVVLKVEMLGNTPGTRGVIYDKYPDFDIPNANGVSIIFENGDYDGFSVEEQDIFLTKEKTFDVSDKIKNYKFENVMKVSRDFDNGLWNEVFN